MSDQTTDERLFLVRWQIGTYHGQELVRAVDRQHACAKAKDRLYREGWCMPMAYENFKAIEQ